ncbi:MAG: CpaE family protein [Actinomycetota bacterium]
MALLPVPEVVDRPFRVVVVDGVPEGFVDGFVDGCIDGPYDEVVDAIAGLDRALGDGRATVAVIGPGHAHAFGLEQLHRLVVAHPHLAPVVVAPDLSTDLLQQAVRAGARDVVARAAGPRALVDAVERVGADLVARGADRAPRPWSDPGAPQRGRLIVVHAPKGGVGTTTVAVNLASALAASGTGAVLVDADLAGGDVALLLGVTPERSALDLVGSVHYAEPEFLRSLLVPVGEGLLVLPAPAEPPGPDGPSPEELVAVSGALRPLGTVVVDLPAGSDALARAFVDEADEIVLVTTLDVAGVKHLHQGLLRLGLAAERDPRCRLVVNRASTRGGLAVREVERVLGLRGAHAVPDDPAVTRAVNAGVPVVRTAPRAPAARELARLASAYAEARSRGRRRRRAARTPEPGSGRRGW